MNAKRDDDSPKLVTRLRKRGVFRVAGSYAVIAWLLLQIADVVLDPLGAPAWVMQAAIVVAAIGFPMAVLLAWFFELGPEGIQRDTEPESATRPSTQGVRRFADLIIIGALLIVIAVLLVQRPDETGRFDGGAPVIAVLPFNELGAADDSFFGMGLADTLIHKLGQLPELIVLTSSSTFSFRRPMTDLAAVAAQLGASVVVEGTVQRAAHRLRINARLVEAMSGRQLWSGKFDRDSSDLFAVQDEIAGAVSRALSIVLGPEAEKRLLQPTTTSLSAFDAYTLGQINLARRSGSVRDAIDFFRQAITLDPDYALAHAALAEALHMAPYYLASEVEWQDVADEAREAAATARKLNSELAEAWLAQYYVAEADNRYGKERIWLDEQLQDWLRRALELNPSSAAATRYLARYADDATEQINLLKRAALLDPRSGIIAYDVAVEYASIGDFDQARDWLLKSGETADPYFRIGYANIPIIYAFDAGELDESARWARLLDQFFPGDFAILHHEALWDLGLLSAADDVLDRIRDQARESGNAQLRAYVAANEYAQAWREGEAKSATSLFRQIEQEFLRDAEDWPDLTRYPGADRLMALHAISLVRAGDGGRALETYRTAIPRPLEYRASLYSAVFFQPALMTAALMKLNGQNGEAQVLIRQFLASTGALPVDGRGGIGHARFMAHALLGDVEAARSAMQQALDANFTAVSWLLEAGRFDPDYQAVMADPSITAQLEILHGRISAMRESYLQQPDLPLEILPARFRSL